jgi:hypothetical protein
MTFNEYCDERGIDRLEWLAPTKHAEFLALKDELAADATHDGFARLASLVETAPDDDAVGYSLVRHFEWLTFETNTPEELERAELVARFCVDEARHFPLFSVMTGMLIIEPQNRMHHAVGMLLGLAEFLRRVNSGRHVPEIDTNYAMSKILKLLIQPGVPPLVTKLVDDAWNDVDDTELVRRFHAAFELLILGEVKTPLPQEYEFRFSRPGRPDNTSESEQSWRDLIGE